MVEVILGKPNQPTQEQIDLNLKIALSESKNFKKTELESQAYQLISEDILYQGNYFQTNFNRNSFENPFESITVAFGNRIQSMSILDQVVWRTKDNTQVNLTRANLIAILKTFYDRQQKIIQQVWKIKEDIKALSSIEDVDSYTFNFTVEGK
jgi:uncharacterized protein YjbI with pentapeptide repeats